MKDQVLIDTDIVLLIQRGNRIVTNHALDYIATFDRLSLTELTWYEIIRGYKISGTYQQLNTFESFCQNYEITPIFSDAYRFLMPTTSNTPPITINDPPRIGGIGIVLFSSLLILIGPISITLRLTV
jgi:hypothetical protein